MLPPIVVSISMVSRSVVSMAMRSIPAVIATVKISIIIPVIHGITCRFATPEKKYKKEEVKAYYPFHINHLIHSILFIRLVDG